MSHLSGIPPHVAIRGFLSGRGKLAWSTLYSLPSTMRFALYFSYTLGTDSLCFAASVFVNERSITHLSFVNLDML